MTQANYTDITILVDRSGSMQAIKNDMEQGFKAFIERTRDEWAGAAGSVQRQRSSNDKCEITVAQFDSQGPVETIIEARAVTQTFSDFSIAPRGGTPLLDALGDTIVMTGKRLARLSESKRPERVLFVVMTDGEENSSHSRTKASVRAQVTQQTDDYKWQFAFLGANFDNFAEAGALGGNSGAILSGSSVHGLWASLSSCAARFVASGTYSYTHAERQQVS